MFGRIFNRKKETNQDFATTKEGIPRGVLFDAEDNKGHVALIKQCDLLYLTYEIRLATFMALKKKKTLLLIRPKNSKLSVELESFIERLNGAVIIDYYKNKI